MNEEIAVKEADHQVGNVAGNHGFSEDREVGPEAVDIERIEKVYR